MRINPDRLPLPREPYRGMLPFRLLDWRIFRERDHEIERLGNLVSMYNGVLLYGQSGAGKSSLLNAGLLPQALRRGHAPERIRVFPECGRELILERIRLREVGDRSPAGEDLPDYLPSRFSSADNDERSVLSCEEFLKRLRAPSKFGVPLLVFDQFEELVTLFEQNPKDEARFESAQAARASIEKLVCSLLLSEQFPVKIVFAFRDDYLAGLSPLFGRIPNLMDQRVQLAPPRFEVITQIVRGPFVESPDGERGLPGHFGHELSNALAEKLAAGIRKRRFSPRLNLSEVQTVCRALWRERKLRAELMGAANPGPVLQEILQSEALCSLKGFLPWDQVRATGLLSNLVTADGTRDVVSEENLICETRRILLIRCASGELKKLLKRMAGESGLLRRTLNGGNVYYELTSESLIPWIQRHQQRFRELARTIWAYASLVLVLVLCGTGWLAYRAGAGQRLAERNFIRADQAEKAAQQQWASAKDQTKKANTTLSSVTQQIWQLQHENKRVEEESKRAEKESEAEWKARLLAQQKKSTTELAAIELAAIELGTTLTNVQRANRLADEAKERAERSERAAKKAKKSADELIEYLSFDLRDNLNPSDSAWERINRRMLVYHEMYPPAEEDVEGWRRKASAFADRGNLLLLAKRFQEAVEFLKNAFDITERLLAQDPDNLRLRSNRAAYAANLSAAFLGNGQLANARDAAEVSVLTAKVLWAREAFRPEWREDLAYSWASRAAAQSAEGDAEAALGSYHESLALQETLTNRLGRAEWQLKTHRDSLALAQKLAKENSRDEGLQAELAYNYWRTASILKVTDPKSRDARAMLKKARSLLLALNQHAELEPEPRRWLESIEESFPTWISKIL